MPLGDIFLAEEPAALPVVDIAETDEAAAGIRWAPLVFLTLLGLVAALALIYLVRYAGDGGARSTREIASPHRLLLPATSHPAAASTADGLPSERPTMPGAQAVDASQPLAADEPETMPAIPARPALEPEPQAAPAEQARRLPRAAATSAMPSAAPFAAGDCWPELRVLNLCGKVDPTP